MEAQVLCKQLVALLAAIAMMVAGVLDSISIRGTVPDAVPFTRRRDAMTCGRH